MHKNTLRELAKFASGLIMGDFIFGLWLYGANRFPFSFLGLNFNQQGILAWLIFDVVLFAFLVHYGWNTGRSRTKGEKRFHWLAGTIFALVAVLHLSRLVFGWSFVLGSWDVPYWLNTLGALITLFLSYASFSLAME